jgi:plasmid maintenance system antidote protein VapI
MTTSQLAPTHPGEVLQDEFLRPLGLNQNRLASAPGVRLELAGVGGR